MVVVISMGGQLMKEVGKRNDEVVQKESSVLMEMEQSRGNIKNEEKRRVGVNTASLTRVSTSVLLGKERKLVRERTRRSWETLFSSCQKSRVQLLVCSSL